MNGVRPTAACALVALICSGCTSSPSQVRPSVPRRGGTYRTALPDLGLSDNLDPTGEYSSVGWELYTALARTLFTYRHIAGSAGNVPVPDLATGMPDVSSDGLTYAFTLKPGVRFGPPIDRPITSEDIEYAFERVDTASLIAQYGTFYDGTIVGMDGPHRGPPAPIPGIETPDDRTIVFHLTRPTGDFLYRLTLPATAPIPREVARCFTQAGQYGRDLIASGPYMLQGSGSLDISSCRSIRPVDGFDPTERILLVRNPDYDAGSDSPSVRSNYVDAVEVTVDTDVHDIFLKIQAGELDGTLNSDSPSSAVLSKYRSDPDLRDRLHSDPAEVTSYLPMNLTTPPFDDVHVRRAVNYAIDRPGLLRLLGGSIHGAVATHIVPPSLLGDRLDAYDPYGAKGGPHIALARREMAASRYDADGDGLCDQTACQHVVLLNMNVPPYTALEPLLVQDLATIGIDVSVRELSGGAAFQRLSDVSARVPIALFPSYGKDYADPYSFARIFSSASIQPSVG